MAKINKTERNKERHLKAEQEHDHAVSLQYNDKMNESKINDVRTQSKETLKNLKENYAKSMDRAAQSSQENFTIARNEMNAIIADSSRENMPY